LERYLNISGKDEEELRTLVQFVDFALFANSKSFHIVIYGHAYLYKNEIERDLCLLIV